MSEPATDTLQGSHGDYVVHSWANAEARYVALIAHGIAEHARRYDHVANALVADGAAVYAPDHYGHGRSTGEPSLVDTIDEMSDDLHLVVDRARAEHPGLPLVLIGHSLGGLIATRFAQRHPGELAALVLSAPAIGGNPVFEQLMAADPMPDVPLDPAALSRDPAVGEAYAADPLVYSGPIKRGSLEGMYAAIDDVAQGPPLDVATLWLHGGDDPLLPREHAAAAIARIRADRVSEREYPGARHEIYNELNRDEVIADTVAFIDAQL